MIEVAARLLAGSLAPVEDAEAACVAPAHYTEGLMGPAPLQTRKAKRG